jgi:hypothetical protein
MAFALIVALGFLAHELAYPSAWDATQYYNMALEMAARGLFSPVEGSEMRTYAYPYLLSLVQRAASASGLSFVALLFALQLLAYCVAALYMRGRLAMASRAAARIAFCGLIVNWYVLIYTPESLTESVSLTLLVLAAAFWVVLWRKGLAAWPMFAGSVTVGLALAVRPASVFLVGAWAFGCAVLWLRQRPSAVRTALLVGIAAVGIALPVAPQVGINATYYGRVTPFVAAELGHLHQILGIRYLKYATALPPVSEAPVPYENPMVAGTVLNEAAPLAWYADYPLRGVATVALHTFNLVDQDLLFTYSRDLRPWYRVPLGLVNHAAVALGVLGLVLLGRTIRARRNPHALDAYVVLLALIAANWATCAWTAVEMRYGAVLLLVLFPLAGYAVIEVGRRDARVRRAVALGTAAYVALALTLSDWVRDQSPLIRNAARAGEHYAQMAFALRGY